MVKYQWRKEHCISTYETHPLQRRISHKSSATGIRLGSKYATALIALCYQQAKIDQRRIRKR